MDETSPHPAHQETLETLDEALRFEELITAISSSFIGLRSEEVDRHIDDALRRLGEFMDADFSTLTEYERDHDHFRVTHRWKSEYGAGAPILLGAVASAQRLRWVAEQLARETPVVIRFEDVPEHAVDELEIMRSMGWRTGVWVPFRVGGDLVGNLAIGSTRRETPWPGRVVARLQLVADIFGSAIARQRTDVALRVQRDAMAHMNRVTTLGELLASIAHEVKQPLAAIVSNAQAARRMVNGSHDDEIRSALADIVDDGKRAAAVIDHLRTLLQRRPAEKEPLDVNALMSNVFAMVTSDAIAAGVTIETDLAGDLPVVSGDRVQVQQVVMNLMRNAADAMLGAGTPKPRLVVSTRPVDGAVRVAVTDAGPGIAPVQREQIFEPFVTTKDDGLGMGLAVCRRIIEAHGGSIAADAGPGGEGTTVWFTLPAEPSL